MARMYRSDRLGQEIEKEISDIMRKRVRDPVFRITITGVNVTGDLQQATVYCCILSDKASDGQKLPKGLKKQKA